MIYVPTLIDTGLRINGDKYLVVNCGNCVWFAPDTDLPPELSVGKDARGRCTLRPPGVGTYGNAPKPVVHAGDHCAEHPLVKTALEIMPAARFLRQPLPAGAVSSYQSDAADRAADADAVAHAARVAQAEDAARKAQAAADYLLGRQDD